MNRQYQKWEEIYLAVTGQLEGEPPGDCEVYDQTWQEIYDARERLCQRFGMDWEDADMERILNAVSVLERDIARRMLAARQEET